MEEGGVHCDERRERLVGKSGLVYVRAEAGANEFNVFRRVK